VNETTNRVYVTNEESDNVSVIDGSNNRVIATVPVGGSPVDVDVNSLTNRIYVANSDSDNVSVIDGISNTVIAVVTVGVDPLGVAIIP
jgi:YVTN family beta-propeller protein